MDLVVTRHALPLGVVNQGGVAHMRAVAWNSHRQSTRHQTDAIGLGHGSQAPLHGAIAIGFSDGQFVGVVLPQQTKILGQHCQLGTRLSGLRQQSLSGVKVGRHLGGGDHLQQSGFHGLTSFCVEPSTLLTLGSFQEPCTRNSWVVDLAKGVFKKYWVRKLVKPTTGLMMV